jgi:arsenate reductase
MITIFHNPQCSKSREGLQLLQKIIEEKSLKLTVIDYQKTPLTRDQLVELQRRLGCPAREMMRANEAIAADESDDERILDAIAAQPALLQRPIVECDGRAVIGRPAERIVALLEERGILQRQAAIHRPAHGR